MFHSASHAGATAVLLGLLLALTSAAKAATLTPCDVLPASEASTIVGKPVKSVLLQSAMPSCMFLLGNNLVFGMNLISFPSEADAKSRLQGLAARKSRIPGSIRQKGVYLVSAWSKTTDLNKLNALLDAAVKHL